MVRTPFENERRENPKEVYGNETINQIVERNISTLTRKRARRVVKRGR
jgi:hypothetical protein